MRRIALFLVLLGTLASRVAAQDAAAVQPRLLDVLARMTDAFDRRDTAAVRRLVTPGFTSTEPDGQVFTAAEVIERAVNNSPDLKVREERLQPATRVSAAGDSAVLRYLSVMSVEQGGREMGTARTWMTDIFVRGGGEWLLAAIRRADAPPPP